MKAEAGPRGAQRQSQRQGAQRSSGWPGTGRRDGAPRGVALLALAAALLGTSCNAAIGGGAVAVLGGAGFLAGQCYDRVRVKVRDPHTGLTTCNASVWVSDADGSERRLRPCYNAALTEGTWKLTARHAGYAPATTELTIPEHKGDCPHYTHTVELTLRREGEPSTPPVAARSATPASNTPSAPTNPLDTPPARVVPPPIPGVTPIPSPLSTPGTPGVPTRTFEPVNPSAPAPSPPAPSPPAPPAPTPPPATPPPATPPAPAPSTPGTPAPPVPATPPAPAPATPTPPPPAPSN